MTSSPSELITEKARVISGKLTYLAEVDCFSNDACREAQGHRVTLITAAKLSSCHLSIHEWKSPRYLVRELHHLQILEKDRRYFRHNIFWTNFVNTSLNLSMVFSPYAKKSCARVTVPNQSFLIRKKLVTSRLPRIPRDIIHGRETIETSQSFRARDNFMTSYSLCENISGQYSHMT